MKQSLIDKFKGKEPLRFPTEYKYLIKNLEDTKTEISDLNANINFITDPILLNQLIFQLKAAEMRYRYWYRLAKDMKISGVE